MSTIQNRSSGQPVPSLTPVPSQAPVRPAVTAAPITVTGPSPTVQQRVEQSQRQSQVLAATSSTAVQQQGSELISASQPSQLASQHQQSSRLLRATEFGQQLVQHGARLHDLAESASEIEIRGVKPLEQLGELSQAIAESPVEGALFELASGISPEAVGTARGALDTGLQVVQACKTVSSLHQAYLSYGTDQFGSHASEALRQSYVTLGGQPTLELGQKIGQFCQERSVDSAREVVTALAEFSSDDSLVSGLERSALSGLSSACLGSSATGYLASAVPVLNFGTAAMDTGLALKAGYDWTQGNASGVDVLKSVITAVGSGTGATIAPVVGPLAAAALNAGIDGVSAGIDFIRSWWS